MTDTPRVSIVMNCFNSETFLREAIESVIGQTYPKWELIFWDNRSTDESAAIARSFPDHRIRYFLADEHTDLGAARNLALGKCTSEFIAFLDCDDLWEPEKLAKQVDQFRRRPEADLLYANYYLLDNEHGSKTLNHVRPQPEGHIFDRLLYSYSVGILTVMVRREALLRQPSLFDTGLSLTEDYELFMRILYGSEAAYLHEPLATYRIHPSMSSIAKREKWVQEYRYVNEKFRALDADGSHTRGLVHRERHVTMTEAVLDMVKGDYSKARRVMVPIRFASSSSFLVYLATFCPAPLWRLLRPLWKRAVVIR
jgi:glycosyltransferase involved in cell wall biosynthesis